MTIGRIFEPYVEKGCTLREHKDYTPCTVWVGGNPFEKIVLEHPVPKYVANQHIKVVTQTPYMRRKKGKENG